jgi:dihydroorotate dehydrogenase electron transfer subunit
MIQEHCRIQSVKEIAPNIFELSFISQAISAQVLPGQFVNIRVEDSLHPLLRRPFSLFSVDAPIVSIIFNAIGIGTKLLSQKKPGETLDIIGPLGNGVFPLNDGGFATALLVAGGLGVATFPFLTSRLSQTKNILTFIGARTTSNVIRTGLENIQIATDDGSEGFHGTVVELFKAFINEQSVDTPRIYSCGPMPMMRAVAQFAKEKNIPCYVALECEMACGIGLCQGCPVETTMGEKKYNLVCKDGPVFETRKVNF